MAGTRKMHRLHRSSTHVLIAKDPKREIKMLLSKNQHLPAWLFFVPFKDLQRPPKLGKKR